MTFFGAFAGKYYQRDDVLIHGILFEINCRFDRSGAGTQAAAVFVPQPIEGVVETLGIRMAPVDGEKPLGIGGLRRMIGSPVDDIS